MASSLRSKRFRYNKGYTEVDISSAGSDDDDDDDEVIIVMDKPPPRIAVALANSLVWTENDDDVMKKCHSVLDTLLTLNLEDREIRDDFVGTEICANIVSVLKKTSTLSTSCKDDDDDESIQAKCCRLITQLTYREEEEENFIKALTAAKAASTIAEAMNKFKDDTYVQYHGCGAFTNLLAAKQKSAAKAALDAGAIKLSTLAMKQHPDVDNVQHNALLCLQNAIIVTDVNLAAKAISAVLLKEKDDDDCIIALALQTMENHSDVLGVQEEAVDFLSALVLHGDDHGVKERILENDGDVTIAKLFTLRHQYDDGNDDDDSDDDDSDNVSSNIAKDAANLLAKLF